MIRGRYVIGAVLACLLSCPALAACGTNDSGAGGSRLTVVASTSIIAALAHEVGGAEVAVQPLIEPGVDPHTFETTPGDARAIADADLVLLNGLGLDDFLLDAIGSANDDAPVATVTVGITLLETGGHAHEESEDHDHDHGAFDPHVWQDPLRVKGMVDNIAAALEEVDPERAETYRDNAAAYGRVLDETDAEIRALIDQIPPDNRKLVTNHDAFRYFANRYGLEIVGTVIPGSSSEADPSAGDIANLLDLIEHEGVAVIFTEALLDPKVAEQLATEAGVEVVHGLYSEQLGPPASGADTVHEMLLANARKISEALR